MILNQIKHYIFPLSPTNKISQDIELMKWFKNHHMRYLSIYYQFKIYKKYNCWISMDADIGKKLLLPHPIGVVIGSGVKLGNNCVLYQNVTIGQKNNMYPHVGDGVTVYTNSVIIGNINIGDNVVIGANSLVTSDIPDNKIAFGSPARIKSGENK